MSLTTEEIQELEELAHEIQAYLVRQGLPTDPEESALMRAYLMRQGVPRAPTHGQPQSAPASTPSSTT